MATGADQYTVIEIETQYAQFRRIVLKVMMQITQHAGEAAVDRFQHHLVVATKENVLGDLGDDGTGFQPALGAHIGQIEMQPDIGVALT